LGISLCCAAFTIFSLPSFLWTWARNRCILRMVGFLALACYWGLKVRLYGFYWRHLLHVTAFWILEFGGVEVGWHLWGLWWLFGFSGCCSHQLEDSSVSSGIIRCLCLVIWVADQHAWHPGYF
jgi:hypothetical protein